MTQAEISKRIYYHHKENGLCVRCGKKNDRERTLCSQCREKATIQQRQVKEWYRENGICPDCRQEKLYGQEKICILCKAKLYEAKQKHKPTEEQQMKYRNNFKEQQRNLYKLRTEQGVCTRCGKFKAAFGKKKCEICLEKDRLAQIKRRERLNNGL